MTEKAHDRELEALRADIARLREEISGLAAGMKKSAGAHARQPHATGPQEGDAADEAGPGVWTDLLRKFDTSRVQGEKVVRDLSAEVERHPLVSVLAAFGLGYIIAKLWYRGTEHEDTDDAS